MTQGFFRTIGLPCLMTGLMLTVPALNTPVSAQAPGPNIPTAGTVLGWELNMNQRYSRQLERDLQGRQQLLEEPPVIFYQDNGKTKPLNDSQFLLNSPKIVK